MNIVGGSCQLGAYVFEEYTLRSSLKVKGKYFYIPYESITNVSILNEENISSGGLKGAAIGGALLGGVGAISGAVIGKKDTKKLFISVECIQGDFLAETTTEEMKRLFIIKQKNTGQTKERLTSLSEISKNKQIAKETEEAKNFKYGCLGIIFVLVALIIFFIFSSDKEKVNAEKTIKERPSPDEIYKKKKTIVNSSKINLSGDVPKKDRAKYKDKINYINSMIIRASKVISMREDCEEVDNSDFDYRYSNPPKKYTFIVRCINHNEKLGVKDFWLNQNDIVTLEKSSPVGYADVSFDHP